MAAEDCLIRAVLRPGDHVLIPHDAYGGTYRLFDKVLAGWGVTYHPVPVSDAGAVRAAAAAHGARLIWVETPTNPLLSIADIGALAQIAHSAGALLAVDNTFASPYLQQPLALGADAVIHSTTKYLNGHSDVVAGTLTTGEESALWLRIKVIRAQIGGIAGPFEAWLLTRGMRTLFPRVWAACAGAQAIAEHFARHPLIERVLYPGLPDFPGHAVARRQMTGGFGGMMSVRVRGRGDGERAAIATAAGVELWKRATSLGGVESLVEHRASVEGAGTPAPPNLLRLSVGIEDPGDLIADLEQALHQAQA
jgi:cystathionine gamma-synthase